MRGNLRAGIALYNAGYHHAAHDPWEAAWLDLDEGDDERLFHGLIQFTAAVHHAREGNVEGATGLAESARGYLKGLPADYRGVNLDAVRSFLAALADDPGVAESPPTLTHGGEAVGPTDLEFEAAAVAAPAVAEAEGYDEEPVERAAEYARRDIDAGETGNPFVALVLDFVRGEERPLAYDRLAAHVERRLTRERDVDGLF